MTILNEYVSHTFPIWPGICLFIISIIGMIYHSIKNNRISEVICSISTVMMVVGLILTYCGIMIKPNNYIQAIVDDKISFKEINEKYTLIKQEGDIFTFMVKPRPQAL